MALSTMDLRIGCSVVCRKFLLLLWKNFILQIRRPIGTFFELVIPPLAILFMVAFKFGVFTAEDRCLASFDSDPLTLPSGVAGDTLMFRNDTGQPFLLHDYMILYYAENDGDVTASMEVASNVSEKLSYLNITLVPVSGEDEMEDLLVIEDDNDRACLGVAGIVFNSINDATNDLEYTLRLRHETDEGSWNTDAASPFFESSGPRIENFYRSEGFLHLQQVVGEAIVEWKMRQLSIPVQTDFAVDMRQIPFPQYTRDPFLLTIGGILPLLLMLAFIYSAGVFVKELVLEKETRIRESMYMMGLSQWVLWSTWYLKQFVFLFISIFIMTILVKAGQVFPRSDFFLLLIFFTLFGTTAISFGFLVSVWMNTARVGLLAGFLTWFLNYMPWFFIQPRYDELNTGAKVASCFFSNTCLGLGVTVITRLESRQEGLLWSNANEAISLDDDFHMGYVYMMLIIDTLLYLGIAWYVNAVKPGQYGVPKPLYFFLLPSYWTGKPLKSKVTTAKELIEVDGLVDHTAFEEEPKDLEVGITVQNLTKIYESFALIRRKKGGRKVAVNNLSLNMYKGQITALLGHNGAGKTTTMSILTGLYTPTSGDATINGYSILTDMDQIRHSLGICPQHNVLFDRLTVKEHLSFFCRLKGVWGKKMQEEVTAMIADLQLVDKTNVPSTALSGGMKRKLSVGIALVGGSEIVVLDEPTSGMDPYARRATWDLLVKHKEGRTVLLTTHFMDEADLLGDRIAIMAEGALQCSGTSLFLKSRYGVGYHMVVVKEAECDSAKVTHMVTSLVQGAEQVTDVGAELSYVLPSSASSSFPSLFEALEARKTELGISSFGISVTTMEEVFIKVGEGLDETTKERLGTLSLAPEGVASHGLAASPPTEAAVTIDVGEGPQAIQEEESVEVRSKPGAHGAATQQDDPEKGRLTGYTSPTYVPNSGIVLWFQQFVAVFVKRVLNSMRFWAAVVTQLILPLVFVILALALAKTLPDPNDNDPSRELRIENSALSSTVYLFYADFDGSNVPVDFSQVSAREVDADRWLPYTAIVNNLINSVENITDPSRCCDYEFQILDKFCAAQDSSVLETQCENANNFGYENCLECLGCSIAREAVLSTCTHPFTNFIEADLEDICHAAPLLSATDAMTPISNLSGPLDNQNTYVAEYLLRIADDESSPNDFFRRYQGGFVITPTRYPPFSVCGCATADTACEYFNLFEPSVSGSCPYYYQPTGNGTDPVCPGDLPGCYTVDGFFGDLIVDAASSVPRETNSRFLFSNATRIAVEEISATCNNGSRPVSAVYPDQADQLTVTIWYNNQPYHMAPAVLNAFHDLWLKEATGMGGLNLKVNNHPLPRTVDAQVDAASENFNGLAIATLTVFGYSFLVASFVLFLVKEKETKAKHLQFVSGVHSTSYWTATFAWDLINALLPVIISFILFAAFQIEAYEGDGLAAIFLLLLLTCWASIPLTYCFSFLFNNSLAAFGLLIIFYYFASFVMQIIIFVIQLEVSLDTADSLHFFFLLMPSYGLAIGLQDIYTNNLVRDTCTESANAEIACNENEDIRYVDSVFDTKRPGVGYIFLYMALEGVFFFLLTLVIERGFFVSDIENLITFLKNRYQQDQTAEEPTVDEPLLIHGEDSDVYNERKKVLTGQTLENEVVVIKDLTKVYSRALDGCTIRPPKKAVRGVSLAIPAGECFGLLGVNGAGKTTTFSILTGDISMSSGTAVIAGFDIKTHLRLVQQRIGYCPQFDALIERLTGRELLTMFARLRGIPERYIKEIADNEIRRLDLAKHADKPCGTYSGGNKRKLSTAIALVGNPPIVLLDEPTTGMDPATRRFLWDVLTSVTHEGRSIVLTSHSMEECEALCTRLAVMVNGRFKCLGSIQHLKNKFGSGFTLQAKVKLSAPPEPVFEPTRKFSFLRQGSKLSNLSPPTSPTAVAPDTPLGGGGTFNPYDTTSLHIFVKEAFPGAVLLEEHQGAVAYQLGGTDVSWSSVFRQLESNKERLGIIDYSVSQTTLEQVFINFAKEQEEEEEEDNQ